MEAQNLLVKTQKQVRASEVQVALKAVKPREDPLARTHSSPLTAMTWASLKRQARSANSLTARSLMDKTA